MGNIETDETTPADKKPASPDTLVEGGKAELSEDELKDVAGGFVKSIDWSGSSGDDVPTEGKI